jgi:hypothetical protein
MIELDFEISTRFILRARAKSWPVLQEFERAKQFRVFLAIRPLG